MKNITANISKLRQATAKAVVQVSVPETIQAVLENRIAKGNVFEMAKTAGFFAVKNTHHSIPGSYPVLVEFTGVEYQITELEIHISLTVKTVGKTGVEVQAMHGASIIALTIYDMLKPIDKGIVIREIDISAKQLKEIGLVDLNFKPFKAGVVVCSNAVFKGNKPDTAGQVIREKLLEVNAELTSYEIIPDEIEQIRLKALKLSQENQLLIFTGGTGLSITDVTPEALEPILERRIPGIEEAIRSYGQKITPYAMFSRSIAGMIGDCLVLALPGSTKGAKESMDAIFPHLLHVFKIMKGVRY